MLVSFRSYFVVWICPNSAQTVSNERRKPKLLRNRLVFRKLREFTQGREPRKIDEKSGFFVIFPPQTSLYLHSIVEDNKHLSLTSRFLTYSYSLFQTLGLFHGLWIDLQTLENSTLFQTGRHLHCLCHLTIFARNDG